MMLVTHLSHNLDESGLFEVKSNSSYGPAFD
jgi:hypothetical protein